MAYEILEEENDFYTIKETLLNSGFYDDYIVDFSHNVSMRLLILGPKDFEKCNFKILSTCCSVYIYGATGENLCSGCDRPADFPFPYHSLYLHGHFQERMNETLLAMQYDVLEALAMSAELEYLAYSYWSAYNY